MDNIRDQFILTRKRREYTQTDSHPKISIDAATYQALQDAAAETGLTISAIARQAIEFAFERLQYVEE